MIRLTSISCLALAAALGPAWAEVPEATIRSLSAPRQRRDAASARSSSRTACPSATTAPKVFDTLDFTNALNVYNNSFRGASAYAHRARAFERSAPRTTTSSSSPS